MTPIIDRLAAFGINEIEPLAVIDEEFLATAMVLAHRVVELFLPAPVQHTELCVLIALGILFFVLPPQQVQRQIELLVGFELAVDVIKVRQRLGARLTGPGREQLFIQILFAEIFGQRPAQ